MVRPFWFARTEIFQNKRNVSRGSPKFPNGVSERKMCLPFAIRNFQAIRQFFDLRHVRCVNMAAAAAAFSSKTISSAGIEPVATNSRARTSKVVFVIRKCDLNSSIE